MLDDGIWPVHCLSDPIALCRNGYLTLDYCERVVQNYTLSGIPLETFVTDIPYMNHLQIFTLSTDYPLPEFQAFVKRLHAANQRWVSCQQLKLFDLGLPVSFAGAI